MAPKVIISYDDTDNDRDALALGRVFADAGAEISLAYVCHLPDDHGRLGEDEARALLARGAEALGRPDATLHVVVSGSTGEGLWALAEREHADAIVFGADYRTAPGNVQPGTSAQRLLEGGPCAIALAPAQLRTYLGFAVRRVGLLADDADGASGTAEALAGALGATVVAPADGPVDLLVVGSRPEAPVGRVNVSAAVAYAIETASAPVLVVPRGVTLPFGPQVAAAA
jgi:nucleotide-binding universal stress UspA family protein